MKKIVFLAVLLTGSVVFNNSSAQLRKVPAEVTEAFKDKFADTKNVSWKDKLSAFQVNFEMEGAQYAAKFTSKGEWLQTEKEIDEDTLPAEVKDGFGKSKFTDWELKQVSRIETNNNGVQYRIFVRKSGVEKKYLYFDETGKLVKDAITI
jgi:Putative beta-lactamase-inhibitor-like, PepSY-like